MALEKDVIINPTDEFTLTIQGTSKTKTVTYYTLFKKLLGNISVDTAVSEEDTLDTVTTRGNTTLNTISVGGVTTNYTLYNTAYTSALQEGMMAWNTADGTLDLRLIGNNVTLQIGQEQVVRVVNKTGADLLEANYQAVKITGAQGNRLKIGLARADSDPNSADTIGIVTETIADNQEGFVTSSGLVRNINTTGSLQGETWADGDVLYLSPTTFGAITNVKPLAPQHTVILGFVVRAQPAQGQIYVKVDNGYELDELHNVRIISEANNDTLLYDSTLSVWKNVPITSVAATLAFRTIAVTGQFPIVADSAADTLTVAAGSGMSITTNGGTDTLTITNNDRGSSQNIFKNIAVAGQSTVVADSNNDTLTLIAGANITLTTDATNDTITINSTGGGGGASGTVTYIDVVGGTGISTTGGPVTTTGTITVTNTDKGSDQFIFKNVAVAGQSDIVADSNNDTLTVAAGTGVSLATNATTDTLTITNSAPDQTVVLTAGANVGITGTYPNFTISSTDQFVGTVTSVDLTAGPGMSVLGGPITTSGSITVTNTDTGSAQNIFKNFAVAGQSTIVADSNNDTLTTAAGTGITLTTNATTDTLTITNSAPDQIVTLTAGTGIVVGGAYPSFTITNSAPDQTVVLTASTGISTAGTYPNFTITNTAPDQIVSITGAGTSVVTGTYPSFTVTSADQFVGTVTSVNLTASTGISVSGGPITSNGSITVTNTDTGSAQNIFKNFAVAGEPTIVADSNNDTLTLAAGSNITITTDATTDTITINATGGGGGTVTSVDLTAGSGISVSGGPITTSGSITVNNTDKGSDQNIFKNVAVAGQSTIVADSNNDTLTAVAGTGITLTTNATTDALTITNSAPDQVVVLTAGTGISTSGTYPNFTITNTAPDQIVSITGAGTSVVTGTYPSFTVTSADQFVGTVTSVGLTAGTGMSVSGGPITSSGSITVTNNDRGSSQNIFKNIAVPTQTTITASSNNDTFTIKPGSGISATTTGNDITLSNTDPGSAQAIFKNVAVAGQSTVVADTNNDTLTLVAGSNIVLTTNATTDSITIDASIPVTATPGDAVYERDYAAPFVITSTWTMVNLNATDIRVSVNKDLSADNRGYFFVTFEVESTQVGPQFRMFKYKLYNANTTTDVVDSESYWVGYMYGTSEVPYTTFSFHIPSADAGVDNGDIIELHVQELSSGTAPDITYAALSYIDAVG